MGAIVLVGVAAVAFAAGRTIVPASDTTGGVSNRQEQQGGGQQDGRQGQGRGRTTTASAVATTARARDVARMARASEMAGAGWTRAAWARWGAACSRAPASTRTATAGCPAATPTVTSTGTGALPGAGLGRLGMRGLDVTGTVTAVTPDSLTIQTEAGVTVTVGLDDGTTYHQEAPAASSDVTTGTKIQVQLDGGVRPSRDANGNINLGTAGDVTVVP